MGQYRQPYYPYYHLVPKIPLLEYLAIQATPLLTANAFRKLLLTLPNGQVQKLAGRIDYLLQGKHDLLGLVGRLGADLF